MLKNLEPLINDFTNRYESITNWPEIKFDDETIEKLESLDNATSVNQYSFQVKIENNHCIIPGQYILYSILLKEFAIELRKHMDVFDSYKSKKGRNIVGDDITSNSVDLSVLDLDEYSSIWALKPLIDSNQRADAKSIINGKSGSYKIRGDVDFYGSVILKLMNVPDASTGIFGKFVYWLTSDLELYDFLERKYLKEFDTIVVGTTLSEFVLKVINFLNQYDKSHSIVEYLKPNASDPSFLSIKEDDISLTSIFKSGKSLLDSAQLSQGGKIRFIEDPIMLSDKYGYLYLSTQWTQGKNSRLDLDIFKSFIENIYPEFNVKIDGNQYSLQSSNTKTNLKFSKPQIQFHKSLFLKESAKAHLKFSLSLVSRYTASLCTKPFVLLSGLSGSGKTKLAQSFAQWICENKEQYCIVPVGADWTNREPLLGYPNALDSNNYVKPENGVLDLLLNAKKHPNKPFFLILDEMNLSHVERYFADFLSAMESDDSIPLHPDKEGKRDNEGKIIPHEIKLPKNLFIVGTVNIDETTYMFSPKVLDRANAIEFRIDTDDITAYLKAPQKINLEKLEGAGAVMAESFVKLSQKEFDVKPNEELNKELIRFFTELKKSGAEFGYRTAGEIHRLFNQLSSETYNLEQKEIIDIAIMQKLLPKVHGSRRKLEDVLHVLASFCVQEGADVEKYLDPKSDLKFNEEVKYPLSLEKICRMYKGAIDNGFASYAEA
nr:hypothetical protein [uncultured Marinifilum sp.]